MLMRMATRVIRRYLVGPGQHFGFAPARDTTLDVRGPVGLYIHIPFCRNLCPYCPYHRVAYDASLIAPYVSALLAEADEYARRLGRVEISSIYIGGGTPTLLLRELGTILDHVRERFEVRGEVCIEMHPGDTSADVLDELVAQGVDLVSLGVQSFDDRYLRAIGRNYPAAILRPAIQRVLARPFRSVNLDLMFALPGQTRDDVLCDLQAAVEAGVAQITAYPLLTFPYSSVGEFRKLSGVRLPNPLRRRAMYRAIHDYCTANGYGRVSVWGFGRGDRPRYSSVTRDHYIGLGAGAGTCLPGSFHLNTFPLETYMAACGPGKLPIALRMELTEAMSRWLWFYWRLYDTYVPRDGLAGLGNDRGKAERLLAALQALGMCRGESDMYALTRRGAFWVHLLQNYFVLGGISKVWAAARDVPWPGAVGI
jgi:oxygen-independent coproporphyrinogen III oxidase